MCPFLSINLTFFCEFVNLISLSTPAISIAFSLLASSGNASSIASIRKSLAWTPSPPNIEPRPAMSTRLVSNLGLFLLNSCCSGLPPLINLLTTEGNKPYCWLNSPLNNSRGDITLLKPLSDSIVVSKLIPCSFRMSSKCFNLSSPCALICVLKLANVVFFCSLDLVGFLYANLK